MDDYLQVEQPLFNNKMTNFAFGYNNEKFSDRILSLIQSPQSNLFPISLEENDSILAGERVIKHIHVSSILLASESRFFLALMSNGMLESEAKEIKLQVKE